MTNKQADAFLNITVVKWATSAFLVYAALHAFVTAWFGSLTGVYSPIKVGQDILVFLLIIPTLVIAVKNRYVFDWAVRDRLNQLIVVYGFIHLLQVIMCGLMDDKAAWAGIIFNLRFLTIFFCVRIALYRYPRFKVGASRWTSRLIIVIASIVAAFAIAQVTVLPHDFLKSFGYDGAMAPEPYSTVDDRMDMLRAFGTLRGPNELGAYLLMPLCLALGYVISKRSIVYGVSVGAILFAMFMTHSRSAMLGAVVAVGIVAIYYFRASITKKRIMVGLAVAVTVAGGLLVGATKIPSLQAFLFHSSSGDASIFEGSTGDHINATSEGIRDVVANPFGHGPGGAGPAAFYTATEKPRIAENYFVQIAQEVGIVGGIFFIAICILLARKLMKGAQTVESVGLVASLAGLSLVGMLLHVWTEEAVAYTWWLLAALVIDDGVGMPNQAQEFLIE